MVWYGGYLNGLVCVFTQSCVISIHPGQQGTSGYCRERVLDHTDLKECLTSLRRYPLGKDGTRFLLGHSRSNLSMVICVAAGFFLLGGEYEAYSNPSMEVFHLVG